MKGLNKLDSNEIKHRLDEWVKSPERQIELEKAMKVAEETCRELREAAKVNPEDLNKPMTI